MAITQIGVIENLHGQVSVIHADGSTGLLQSGSKVYAGDTVITAEDAAAGIRLTDGSVYTLGPEFTAILNNDIFDPSGFASSIQSSSADGATAGLMELSHAGVVTALAGDVEVIHADGSIETLHTGDYVYADDVIKTSANSSADLKLLDGSARHAGPDTMISLDDGVPAPGFETPDTLASARADAADIVQSILEGEDPTATAEAPAAGEEAQDDSGTSFVRLEESGRRVTPESGYETTGVGYGFTDVHDELLQGLQDQQDQQEVPVINLVSQDNLGDVVTEGETLLFAVSLDRPNLNDDVTATWTITPGTAGQDDLASGAPLSGTVTIPRGETHATFGIPTFDDDLFEGGPGTFENLTVTLSDIGNARAGDVTALGLIEDNDETEVGFRPGADGTDVTVTEGDPGGVDATITFTLELSNPSASPVSVDYTVVPGTAGVPEDYTGALDALSGTVVFAAGETSASLTLDVTDDLLVESSEQFTVVLSDPTGATLGANATATGTILDNDETEVGFRPGADGTDVTVTEGDPGGVDATITFTLELSNPSASPVSVDYTVVPGTAGVPEDYTGALDALSGTVVFAAGETSASLTLDVTDDLLVESSEQFTVVLSDPTGATLGANATATGTILDNDETEVGFRPGADGTDVTVTEGDPGGVDATITFTLELSNPSASPVSVDYTVVPGTAGVPEDYTGALDALSGTVVFAAGETSASLTLDVTDDLLVESSEQFTVVLSDPTGATLGANATATGTILDNDETEVGFRPGADGTDVTVTEGDPGGVDATITFTLELSNPSASPVSVDYTVVPGTAGVPEDYTGALDALSGTVVFAAGETSASLTLDVTDDLLVESSEQFTVVLSDPTGATLGANATATGTILDNDETEVGFRPGADGTDVTVTEGDPGGVDATITFTLELSNPSASPVSVDYTVVPGTAGVPEDYTGALDALSGTVVFAAGETSASLTLDVTDDLLVESSEQFTVVLSDPTGATLGANATATGTILDNDETEVGFRPGADGTDVTVTEGDPGGVDATITFTLELSNPSASPVSVDYTVVPGTAGVPEDYTGALDALSGTVVFAAGETSASLTLDVTDDLLVESSEQFTVVLSDPTGATLGANATATGTILDNDETEVGFRPGADGTDVTVTEGDPGGVDATITFTLELSNPSASPVSVDYTVVPGTAGVPEDYTGALDALSGTVVFAAGETSASLTLDVTDDLLVESSEQFTVVLSDPTGATLGANATATGTILDNDETEVGFRPGADGTDVTVTEGDPGGVDATITFTLELSNPSASPVSVDYTVVPGTAGVPEDYTGALDALSGTVVFAAGETSASLTLDVTDDLLVESSEQFTVVLSDPTGATLGANATATGTILDNDETEVGFRPGADGTDVTVTEGDPGGVDATITFTLELSNPSASPVSVDYTVVPGTAGVPEDYTGALDALSGTVVFAAGETSASLTLDVTDDLLVESSEQFTVVLSDPTGATLGANATATGTILDNDETEVGFRPGADGTDVTVTEGDPGGVDATITFTLELSNPSASPVSVDYTVVPGTAGVPEDYTGALDALSGTVVFAAGETSASLTLDVTDDLLVESSEQFTVVLSDPTGATLGANATATGTILDNDETEVGFRPGADGTDVTVTEGDPGGVDATITFTLELSNPSASPVSVDYTVVPGTAGVPEDYTGALDALSGTVVFAAGETSASLTLDVTDDLLVESSEQFTVVLSDPTGATLGANATATGTILDNDETEVGFRPGADGTDVTVTEGDPGGVDATITFTLELSNPSASPVSVDYTVVPGTAGVPEDYTGALDALSGTVVFAAGETSASLTLDVTDDLLVESSEQFTVVLSDPTGATLGANATATGTILDNDDFIVEELVGQVTEAALLDGPADFDEGSQNDPAQPGVNTQSSGTLTFAGGDLSAVNYISGPGGGVIDNSNATQYVLDAADGSWQLAVSRATGEYQFELLGNVAHPAGDDLAFDQGALPVQFTYTVSAPGGSENGSLTIDLRDDRPEAINVDVHVADVPIDTNLVVVLDRSGSMKDDPGVDGFSSRIALAKEAVSQLMDAYAENGAVNILIVDFSGSAENSGWLSLADAKTYLDGLGAGGWTDYQDAINEVQAAYNPAGDPAPLADQAFVYFLSDGDPQGPGGESDGALDADDVAAWEAFLGDPDNNIDKSWAVGIGDGLNPLTDPRNQLDEVAYPNGDSGNPILVVDESELIDTLLGTVTNIQSGNLISSSDSASVNTHSEFTYGSDGPADPDNLVLSLQVDGTTYTYDPDADEITGGTTPIAGSELSVTTALGADLTVDFVTGDYSYVIPNVVTDQQEAFQYTIVDADGDTDTGTFTVHTGAISEVNGEYTTYDIIGGEGIDLMYGTARDDVMDGGAGTDVLVGRDGADQLTGGAGADKFVFNALDEGVDAITDYNNNESDVIDISDILTGFDPDNDTLSDFVSITSDGTDATVAVDPGGSGAYTDIALLSNITAGTLVTIQTGEDTSETLIVA